MMQSDGLAQTVPWRCQRCGTVIATVRRGRAQLERPERVILDAAGALVVCPVCGTARRWRPASSPGLELGGLAFAESVV